MKAPQFSGICPVKRMTNQLTMDRISTPMKKTKNTTIGGMTRSQFNSGRQRGISAGLVTSRFNGYVVAIAAPSFAVFGDPSPSLDAAAGTGLSSASSTP